MRDPADSEDLVLWMLRALVDEFPQVGTVAWLRLEMAMRQRWGGKRVYIARTRTASHAQREPRRVYLA